MTQIFTAFAGGTIVIGGEMAMMAPSGHQHIAIIIAILDLFCNIGGAIGSTVSAAYGHIPSLKLWRSVFPATPIWPAYMEISRSSCLTLKERQQETLSIMLTARRSGLC